MINRVILVGRMTRDPELRRTPTGASVTSFSLAVNRTFTSANGERQADFINCVVWNKSAENVERYCSKGSLVGVEGRLQSRQYDAQDGSKRTVIEVVCDSIQFIETKKVNRETEGAVNRREYPELAEDIEFTIVSNNFDIKDDDIQF